MAGKMFNVTLNSLKKIVKESYSITEVLKKLGYSNSRAGSSRKRLKDLFIDRGLDFSHFEIKRGVNLKSIPLSKILVANSTYQNMYRLKKRLLVEKLLKYKCAICGISEWLGKTLSLQIDHMNGINNDHRLENLRLLCPNCHSQTDTFSGRNMNKN